MYATLSNLSSKNGLLDLINNQGVPTSNYVHVKFCERVSPRAIRRPETATFKRTT
ncbi:hypothetical protein CLF_102263 [Clonorchis sinensis]|uniref:Uncharacterized protein n=1 Tax=Clonorchis sinensis TaxID=79923 RepID=G7Y7M1_CLOSI|nr:hypothetical protein CLF_102263 [Clonorchis sinensis]